MRAISHRNHLGDISGCSEGGKGLGEATLIGGVPENEGRAIKRSEVDLVTAFVGSKGKGGGAKCLNRRQFSNQNTNRNQDVLGRGGGRFQMDPNKLPASWE